MKVKMSSFLKSQKDNAKKLVEGLAEDYKYVSLLGTDTAGKLYQVQRSGTSIDDSMWVERGFVVRVHNGINYTEHSFNEIPDGDLESLIKKISSRVKVDLERLNSASVKLTSYPVLEEDSLQKSFLGEVEILPDEMSAKEKIEKMISLRDKAFQKSKLLIDFRVIYEEVHVSKIFISTCKDLEQSYIWNQSMLVPIVRKGEDTKYFFDGVSGLKGPEALDELEEKYEDTISTAEGLLDAGKVVPGEYDIICAPEIAGILAHEAFGHGVEMDMFVKNRAKAVEYLGKPVASDLVVMHDGAAAADHVSSYLFDDEGVMGKDTVIIDNGILKTGISDALSALRLDKKPTGNGKRESFERKAYSRMTNTFFGPGKDKLEDMIASIDKGYLLEGGMSGMEDPKNWGIQLMISQGKEIKDGKLTGNIVSPVIMTGYVPDVLKSISMVSREVELFGTGACGKGYKEYSKVSDGGPYIKTRARLG